MINSILFTLIIMTANITPDRADCYTYVNSIVKKKEVARAVLASAQVNRIALPILLAYLLNENAAFKNLPLNASGDVGLFQININYHDHPLEVLMNMQSNALIAGQIIRENLTADPSLFGLGRYFNSDPEKKLNEKYTKRLSRNLIKVLNKRRKYQCYS